MKDFVRILFANCSQNFHGRVTDYSYEDIKDIHQM